MTVPGETKWKPILFSGEMVRAIRAGRKTQTRRVCPDQSEYANVLVGQSRINAGNSLWVRESFYIDHSKWFGRLPKQKPVDDDDWDDLNIYYRADGDCCSQIPECACAEVGKPKWRPSIFMPRWASRISLGVTALRVERLQDISEADAMAEGVTPDIPFGDPIPDEHRQAFRYLWDRINGKKHPWASNPWVNVITFTGATK